MRTSLTDETRVDTQYPSQQPCSTHPKEAAVTDSDDSQQAYYMWLLVGALTRRLGGEVTVSGEELYECSRREGIIEERGAAYCVKIGGRR